VDLAGTCRWKAAGPPREEPGDTAFFRLALRLSWPPRALVLSVLLLIFSPLGSIALRLLWAGIPTALRPVAFDIVFDFVIPRFPLGEVGARESEEPDEKLDVFAVLGLVGVAADWLSLAVFSLIVAESTVFCRLKFEFVLVWLLLVEVRGTAVGGPVLPLLGLLLLVALMLLWTPLCPPTPPPVPV